jgi:ATP synthase protein I
MDKQSQFIKRVSSQITRKIKAGKKRDHIWFGFGMFGLIGWSVALPVVLGAWLGIWLDQEYPSGHSWTLILLVAGLCIGCWNAARWVIKENNEMQEEEKKDE